MENKTEAQGDVTEIIFIAVDNSIIKKMHELKPGVRYTITKAEQRKYGKLCYAYIDDFPDDTISFYTNENLERYLSNEKTILPVTIEILEIRTGHSKTYNKPYYLVDFKVINNIVYDHN